MSSIQAKVTELQSQIYKQKYYIAHWEEQLKRHNISTATIDQHEHSDRELILLCHHMWESLPDSKDIRRPPFFQLCEIAEHIFDDGAV